MTSRAWPTRTLDELVDRGRTITYGVVRPGEEDPAGVFLVRGGDIHRGRIEARRLRRIAPRLSNAHPRTRLQGGELLVSLVGNPGEVALVPAELAGSNVARQVGLVPLNEAVNPAFVMYFLMSPAGRARLGEKRKGSVQVVINLVDLRSIRVPVPPRDVQDHIAGVLSAYDNLIENDARRIEILDEMARSSYREWFLDGRFPGHDEPGRGWASVSLESVVTYINRGITPYYADDGPELVIGQKCVRDRRLSLEPARRHRTKVPPEKYVRRGDVLINSTGIGTLGRVAQVLEDVPACAVDAHVTIVRPSDSVDPHYFGLTLLAKESYFESQGAGATGQTELARARVAAAEVLLPPFTLQRRFGALVGPMRAAAASLAKRNVVLRNTRDLLLPRLFGGESDVSPTPASHGMMSE